MRVSSPLHQDMIAQMPFLQWLTLYEPTMIADACNFEDRVSAKVKVRANADGVEVGLTLFALLMGQTKGVCFFCSHLRPNHFFALTQAGERPEMASGPRLCAGRLGDNPKQLGH